jgi:hypothetical protein
MKNVEARREATPTPYVLSYHALRNITSPEDAAAGRKVYAGTAPFQSLLGVPNNENLRDYLPDDPGKKRRRLTAVHREMFTTLDTAPETFSAKNSGFVIVARNADVDEQKKAVRLVRPSIINGAQTQGVLREYLEECAEEDVDPFPIHPKFELVVTKDDALISEISIARNTQNDVKPLTIAHARGFLRDIERVMAKKSNTSIRVTESDTSDEHADTEKLLQVLAALMPQRLASPGSDDPPNKVYTYSMRAKCLKDFIECQIKKEEAQTEAERDLARARYSFYISAAPEAQKIYEHWKAHQGFAGKYLKQGVRRDDKGSILEVADGLVFPIFSALSVFMTEQKGGWKLKYPPLFDEGTLIDQVKTALRSYNVSGNPWNLGKSRDAYMQLYTVTSTYQKMAAQLMKEFSVARARTAS